MYKLNKPIPLQGFDEQPSKAIRKIFEVNLRIDRRIQPRQYLLVAELGSYNLILGRK